MGHDMVPGVGLVVVQVGEAGSVGVSQPERPPSVSVVNSVTVLSLHELKEVILNDGSLAHCSRLSAGSFTTDAVAEGENVLVFVVLEGVSVHVHSTVGSGETCINKPLVGLALGVDARSVEIFLDDFAGINVTEHCDLLVDFVEFNLEHLPSEHDINASLGALLEGDLVGIGEGVDEFVGSPELQAGVGRISLDALVLAHEVLVVEGIEVRAFSLVWHGRRVTNEVAVSVGITVIVVLCDGGLVVDGMDENVGAVVHGGHLFQTLDVAGLVVETGSQHKRLVGELFAV